MEVIEKMVLDFVEFYNSYTCNKEDEQIKECFNTFGEDILYLENNKIDYLSILEEEFGEDIQLHILLLSGLFLVLHDNKFLDRVEALLYRDKLSIDISLGIMRQVNISRFANDVAGTGYDAMRKLHLHMLNRMEREWNVSEKYIPYEERDHNLIILETNTFLSPAFHAPSKMLLDTYKVLKYKMGYDVLLLVNVLKSDDFFIEDFWTMPYTFNYIPTSDGEEYFSRTYDGVSVEGYQYLVSQSKYSNLEKEFKMLRLKKPEFIWHIGEQSVLSDLFGRITTLVSMPCTDGYAISEAPILASYMQVDVEKVKKMEEYSIDHAQKVIRIKSLLNNENLVEYGRSEKRYEPADFNVPNDSFIIAIVGNRLTTEINHEFIQIMSEIARREKKVYFLIIGNCSIEFDQGVLKGRVRKLGFRKDLMDILKLAHLFLNPPRKGGGGAAAYAVVTDCPVVTLPNCDVANIGEQFVCESLDQFPELVSKYCNDKAFYQRQVEYCESLQKNIQKLDNSREIEKLICFVRNCIK